MSAALRDQLASTVLPSTATFANVVRPLIDDENRAACRLRVLGTLLASVSPAPALREASREAQKQILAAEAANLMRRDIASLVAGVFRSSHADVDLDAQDRYLLTRVHGEYLRSGAGIQDNIQRARLQAALSELNELRIAAQKAFTEADDGLWSLRSELAGIPEDTLATMTVAADESSSEADDRLWVTFRNNHFGDSMRHALSGETRRKLYVAKQHRFPENIERLAKMVVLKDEIARLLRFENYAALKMEEKMAHSVGNVKAHLHEVRKRMEPLAKKETERLLLLKKKDIASRRDNSEDASTLYVWDWAYYSHKQRKESYSINTERLAQYFEVMHTIKKMLGVFERLFGMEFEKIEASVWHEDVTVYSVWDSVSEGGGFLGYLYLDLVAREGKYRGAHHLLIRPVSNLFIFTVVLRGHHSIGNRIKLTIS
jgi:metallopeptidase MepB